LIRAKALQNTGKHRQAAPLFAKALA
jgi:hypothetical protein